MLEPAVGGAGEGPEPVRIADHQPVAGWHQRDPLAILEPPDNQGPIGFGIGLIQRISVEDRGQASLGIPGHPVGAASPIDRKDGAATAHPASALGRPVGPRTGLAIRIARHAPRRGRSAQAMGGSGSEGDSDTGGGGGGAVRQGFPPRGGQLTDQIDARLSQFLPDRQGQVDGTGFLELGVGEDQHPIQPVGGVPSQGVDRTLGFAQPLEHRSVEEARMVADQSIHRGQFGDQRLAGSPRQPAAAVHVDLLGRTPFDSGRESEAALDGRQGRQSVAEERPAAPLRRGGLARHAPIGGQA